MVIEAANRLNSVSEYYFSKKLKEIRQLNQNGHDIINLGIGSPDLPPDNIVIQTLQDSSTLRNNHGYQSYTGLPELRAAISNYQKQHYNIQFNPENEILPLIGSKEGIMHISMAFLNPGDKVLVPNPGYPTYQSVSRLVSADLVTYNLNPENWMIDFDQLSRLPLDEVKLMWVNYPNMPTGQKGAIEQFEQLIQLAEKHRFLIVNDNPYGQLFEGDQLSIFNANESRKYCLELNSLSKSHNMAGWRLGWISGDSSYIETILKVKSNMDSGMFKPLQLAACEALKLDNNWFESLRKTYVKRRKLAFQILQALNCSFNELQGGMFVWGKAPESVSDVAKWLEELMMESKVFITPGFIFGSQGERSVRISLCSNEQTLETSLKRIKAAIA